MSLRSTSRGNKVRPTQRRHEQDLVLGNLISISTIINCNRCRSIVDLEPELGNRLVRLYRYDETVFVQRDAQLSRYR